MPAAVGGANHECTALGHPVRTGADQLGVGTTSPTSASRATSEA